jgi:ABC-type sugar transport system ATPase subunit
MSIRENITLASLRSVSTLGFLSTPREERQAADLIQQLNIVARSSEQLVATLSGGNQQKCVLGKWLSTAPRLLMLDEPTRGIDVGAKAQIHKLIDHIANSGVAILMISSELPELIGISDRVYVMREGGVVSELKAGPDLTQERVVAYMV